MLCCMIDKLLKFPSVLRLKYSTKYYRWLFRKKGIAFGNNMSILGRISVIGSGKIVIGDNFCMTSGEHINPISSNLQASFFTDSPEAQIRIGNNVGMSSPRIWIHKGLTIGDNVKIGGGVLLIDTDCHPVDYVVRRTSNEETCSAPIVIKDDVWIGAQCIILKGVTIGARSIIGAGSVVTKDIPSDCIAGGNPCKVLKMMV